MDQQRAARLAPNPPEPPAPPREPTSGPPRSAHDIPVHDPWSEPPPTTRASSTPDGSRVACWTGRDAAVLSVPEPLLYEDEESAIAWRIDLATGDICTAHTGEPAFTGVEPLRMVCEPGKRARCAWSWASGTEIQTSAEIDGELIPTKVVAQYR